MPADEPICILGAGLAGGRAAVALREHGYAGRLLLLGEEPDPPYDRPPLSKTYLTGQLPKEKLLLHSETFYKEHGIEWRGATLVTDIDRSHQEIQLADGSRIPYWKLLLTTGSRASSLPVPGAQLPGVLTLHSLSDADRLRPLLTASSRVLVVGAGFLGCELAAAARTLGCQVLVVEAGRLPLLAMGEEAGRFALRLHREHEVEIRCSTSVVRFRGGPRVEVAVLADGTQAVCDLALICVGARPRVGLAGRAGLQLADGVVVDGHCRTSDPHIYAAGDVARFWDPDLHRRVRLEHWDNAQRQGAHAASAMLGSADPYRSLTYFWSEQYDSRLQQVGLVRPGQTRVVRGDPAQHSFSVLYLRQRRLLACVAVNRFPDLAGARRLISNHQDLDPDELAQDSTDLRQLASAGT